MHALQYSFTNPRLHANIMDALTIRRSALFMLSVISLGFAARLTPVCQCQNPDHCQLIKSPARKEVFVFRASVNDDWKRYDWSKITTIAPFGKYIPELMCHAHSKGARFVLTAGYPVAELANDTSRSRWIKKQVNTALDGHMDGINIDFEAALNESEAHYLVALVNETATAFRMINLHAQISFDTPYAAGCTWGRCYDYKYLAEICNFLVLMNYDMFVPGMAIPNDPIKLFKQGVESFEVAGIPPNKLVPAFPWYGYDYECNHMLKENVCLTRSVNLTERKQLCYSIVTRMLQNLTTSGILNRTYASKFFDYKESDTSQTHQVWYDDPETLSLRYQYAKIHNLRGVSMWEADCLDYSDDPEVRKLTKAMWDAIDQFIP